MWPRAIIVAFAVMTAFEVGATTTWQDQLAFQLEHEEGCTLSFLSQVVEREVDDQEIVIAKAHCEDKRAFDVFRDEDQEPFTIKPCGVVEEIEC